MVFTLLLIPDIKKLNLSDFSLHILWIGQFIQLFAPLTARNGILWYLRPLDPDEKIFHPAIWRSTVKAKVRFECEVRASIFFINLNKFRH